MEYQKPSYEEGESGRNKAKKQETGVPDFGMGCFPSFPFYSKVRSMLIENMGVGLVATNSRETKERKPKEKVQ